MRHSRVLLRAVDSAQNQQFDALRQVLRSSQVSFPQFLSNLVFPEQSKLLFLNLALTTISFLLKDYRMLSITSTG